MSNTNTKTNIPQGQGMQAEDTDLNLPTLPDPWEWRTVNRTSLTHKVNLYFGHDVYEPGGWLGEIDNYIEDGEEVWDIHVREILDEPEYEPHGTIPAGNPETVEQFDSFHAAIEAVSNHIETYYEVDDDE